MFHFSGSNNGNRDNPPVLNCLVKISQFLGKQEMDKGICSVTLEILKDTQEYLGVQGVSKFPSHRDPSWSFSLRDRHSTSSKQCLQCLSNCGDKHGGRSNCLTKQ